MMLFSRPVADLKNILQLNVYNETIIKTQIVK